MSKKSGEEWPKRLDLSDPEISQILTDAFAKLKDGGNGILPLLRECYPGFSDDGGPESFFRKIGLLDEKGELAADRGKISLRTLCEARGQFEDSFGAFTEREGISPEDSALLKQPIDEAVEAVRGRVEEWHKERMAGGAQGDAGVGAGQADAGRGDRQGFRDLQKSVAKPRSNLEIGKTLLKGTLKVERQEDGSVRMSFGSDNDVFFNSPFASRSVVVGSGLMVRSAKNVLKKLSGKIGKGKTMSVECIAKVVDLEIVQRREGRNDHDFYVDIVSVSPESLTAAKAFDVGGGRIPLLDLYKVEDPEGERVKEGEGFKGFKEIEMGKTEIKGSLLVRNPSHGMLVSNYLDAKFEMSSDGHVYYCNAEGRILFLPARILVSVSEARYLMKNLPYHLPSGHSCRLDATVVLAGDFGDGEVRDSRLRVEIKSIGDNVDGKPLENLSEGMVLDGVWEIIADDQGSVCRAVFWPDGLDRFTYCADYGDKKIIAPEVFFAEANNAKCCFPRGTSFKRGRNYFRGQGKFRHVTNLNRSRHGFAPDHKFIFEPVDVVGELDDGEKRRTEEKLIVPGDHVPGFLCVSRGSPDDFFVQVYLDRDSVGDRDFVDTSVEGIGCMRTIGLNSLHQFTIADKRKLEERFGDFEIGERATFKCDAELLSCSSWSVSDVRIEQIGEKTGDDRGECKVVDFKEGDIDINSARFRGKLVVKGFDIDNWYFVLNEGMGPYHFDSTDRTGRPQRVCLDSGSKLKISKYGGKALSCDVLNCIAGRDEKGVGAERVFDVEVFLKNDWLYGGVLACVARVGKELTAAAEVSANNLDSLARTLGGKKAHQSEVNGKLVTGCVLGGRLNVKNTGGNLSMTFSLPWRGEGNGYKSVNETGNVVDVSSELSVVNGDEMIGALPLKKPESGWTSYLGCEVMFCDPTSRYPGMCSVFVLKTFNN